MLLCKEETKVYGSKGSETREQYEKDFKTELIENFLKKLRVQENLTQEQLAEIMKIDKSYISKIENNIKEVRLSTLQKIVQLGLGGKLDLTIRL